MPEAMPVTGGYNHGGGVFSVNPPDNTVRREERWIVNPTSRMPDANPVIGGTQVLRGSPDIPDALLELLPKFTPLPQVPRGESVSEAIKTRGEELEAFRADIDRSRKKFIADLKELHSGATIAELPAPGSRLRRESELLRAEAVFRGQLVEYLELLIGACGSAGGGKARAALEVKADVEKRIRGLLETLKIPEKRFVTEITRMAVASALFTEASNKAAQDDRRVVIWKKLAAEPFEERINKRLSQLNHELTLLH